MPNVPRQDETFEVAGVSVVRSTPERAEPAWAWVYAPGAGSSIRDPFGTYASALLTERGIATVRFQFPYMERGSKRPDAPRTLEATWRAVLEASRRDGVRLIASGRSMGGRVASMVVASPSRSALGEQADALALFAYPLHAPGRADRPRIEHLASIGVPTLFCSGTRDAFGTPEELRDAAALVGGSVVHVLEGADHGFAVLKSSGRTREDVWREAVEAMLAWLPDA